MSDTPRTDEARLPYGDYCDPGLMAEMERELAAKDALLDKYRSAMRENVISARIITAENAGRSYAVTRDARFIEDRSNAVLALTPEAVGAEIQKLTTMRLQLNRLSDRITQYLGVGGLFNPEAMEHDKGARFADGDSRCD